MKENAAWSRVARHLPKEMHVVRLENWAGPGTPDVNLCYQTWETWVENKVASVRGKVTFRKEQGPWILRRVRAGGRVFILVYWAKNYYLYRGTEFEILRDNGCGAVEGVLMDVGAKAIAEWLTNLRRFVP